VQGGFAARSNPPSRLRTVRSPVPHPFPPLPPLRARAHGARAPRRESENRPHPRPTPISGSRAGMPLPKWRLAELFSIEAWDSGSTTTKHPHNPIISQPIDQSPESPYPSPYHSISLSLHLDLPPSLFIFIPLHHRVCPLSLPTYLCLLLLTSLLPAVPATPSLHPALPAHRPIAHRSSPCPCACHPTTVRSPLPLAPVARTLDRDFLSHGFVPNPRRDAETGEPKHAYLTTIRHATDASSRTRPRPPSPAASDHQRRALTQGRPWASRSGPLLAGACWLFPLLKT
jgi:hypothetical protein